MIKNAQYKPLTEIVENIAEYEEDSDMEEADTEIDTDIELYTDTDSDIEIESYTDTESDSEIDMIITVREVIVDNHIRFQCSSCHRLFRLNIAANIHIHRNH